MPDDVAILRQILQRELETINAYEEMSERLQDPALRQIVAHITDEEREHVAEMYQLILERDAKQAATAARGRQHLDSALEVASTPVPKEAPPHIGSLGDAVDLVPPPPPGLPDLCLVGRPAQAEELTECLWPILPIFSRTVTCPSPRSGGAS